MFTGLIAGIGRVAALSSRGGGAASLRIDHTGWDTPLRIGESIAVQGVCLTVAAVAPGGFVSHILRETMDCSNLGKLRAGAPVNLERALRAGDPLGGHLVSGHVDGQGVCAAIRRAGPDRVVDVRAAAGILEAMTLKGSVACDGISLTVARLTAGGFSVHVIPHTWSHTAWQWLGAGDSINLETDMLGKYAARRAAAASPSGGITEERLRQYGFAG